MELMFFLNLKSELDEFTPLEGSMGTSHGDNLSLSNQKVSWTVLKFVGESSG